MKISFVFLSLFSLALSGCFSPTQKETATGQPQPLKVSDHQKDARQLFLDIHELEPGKVTFEAVAEAHLKDLETQEKYGVSFIKFWVDESEGKVYCLSEASSPEAIRQTHATAHGLLPDEIHRVEEGE